MKKKDEKDPSIEQLLTGEYVGELKGNDKPEPNAELERGEYLKYPDMTVQKVVGDKHTNGGVEMFLPDGTRILSDNLKLTSDQVKFLNNNFGVKTSTNDTYAKTVEKYSKLIGLSKLNDDQEGYISTLKKQEEDEVEEQTANVNNEFLNQKIYDIEQEKIPLEEERSKFFDVVYKMQEEFKKDSGEEYDNTMFKYGGITRINFDKMLKEKGITEETALELLAKESKFFSYGGKKEKKQDGGAMEKTINRGSGTQYLLNSAGRPINYRYVQYATNPEVKNQEGQTGYFAKYSKPVGSRTEFSDFTFDAAEADNFFLEKGTPVEGYELVTVPEGEEDPYIEKLYQKPNTGDFSSSDKIREKFFKKEYFKGGGKKEYQDGDQTGSIERRQVPYEESEAFGPKGLQRLNRKRQEYGLAPVQNADRESILAGVSELQKKVAETNPELVIDYMLNRSHQPNNKLVQDIERINQEKGTSYEATNEGVKQALEAGDLTRENIVEDFQDDKWWYRSPETTVKQVTPEELKKIQEENKDKFIQSNDFSYLPSEEDPDVYVRYITTPEEEPTLEQKTEDPIVEGEIEDKGVVDTKRNYPKYFYTPFQGSLPPSPMEPHLKVETRFGRLDPVRIGIEDQLQASADTRRAVEAQLQDLPPTQRAAALANLTSSTQQAENQALTQAARINAENLAKTEMFNIGQADREEVYSGNNALDFERRQLTAKAKTEEEMRNWLDQNRRIALNNYANQQKLNLMSQLFPDQQLDFFGNQVNYAPEGDWQIQDRTNRMSVGVQSDI